MSSLSSSLHEPSSRSSVPPVGERVLLLHEATPGMEGARRTLEEAGFQVALFATVDALFRALREGGGCIVVPEEAVTERSVRMLTRTMARRPPWSNLPIIVLTSGRPSSVQRLNDLELFGPATSSNITILERPVHEITLITVLRSALRARRRQYEVRDLLKHLEATNEELRASQAELQDANQTLEERVAERTDQVRNLALALTTAEQRERSRISQILHDHLQQLVHGAKMWIESVQAGDTSSDESLPRALGLLQEALETTRSLTVELSPPVLRSEGFAPALRWLADHVGDTHNLAVHLELDDDLEIPSEDLRTLLFQMVRELLFNVVKHAGVSEAAVSAHRENGRVVVDVVDEGKGFDADNLDADASPDDSFGLFSVRERLDLIGGHLTVDTAPDEGTHVRLDAPLGG